MKGIVGQATNLTKTNKNDKKKLKSRNNIFNQIRKLREKQSEIAG